MFGILNGCYLADLKRLATGLEIVGPYKLKNQWVTALEIKLGSCTLCAVDKISPVSVSLGLYESKLVH